MTMLATLLLAAARPALYLPIGLGCRVELPTDGVAREPWKAEQGRLVMSPPRYPGPGYSMPWVSLTDGEVCRYWQAATLDRAPLGFRIAYDPATSNVDVTADRPIVAETLSGGWHAAARRYRAAWDRQFRLARQTEAVRTMSGFLLVILKQQNGEIIWPYGDFAELADRCAERGLDWVGLFGWTRDGHDNRYPDYEPDPAQGGREALAAGIDLLHRRGLKVFLYANGQLQERGTTDYWKTVGKDARLVDPKGVPQGETWHKYSDAPAHHFDYACLSMPCWHEAMRRVARLSAELGADGLLYDQLGTTAPRRCFATGHRHAPGDWVYAADRAELMEDVLAEARQVKDDFLVLTEGLHDSLLSSVAAYHGWVKGTVPVQGISFLGPNPPELDYPPYPFIFQYAFPELVCSVRIPTPLEPRAWANYAVLTGLRHELEIRYAPDRRYARDGRRPDPADYGTIRQKPAIDEMCREDAAGSVRYLKALTTLQRRFADAFYGGRFTDDEGFSCEAPAGVVAKSFTGDRRRVVVVCNFTSRAATVRIRSGERLIGAYEPEREGAILPGGELAPDALRLYVFDLGDTIEAAVWSGTVDNPALPPVEKLPVPAGDPVRLIEDGKANFCIVGAFKAERAVRGPEGQPLARFGRDSAGRAAWAIKDAFKRTAGIEVESFEEGDPRASAYRYVIAVGETALAAKLGLSPRTLPREGFEVRTFPGGLVIAGMDGFAIPGTFDRFSWRSSRLTCNGTEMGARDFVERFLGVRRYAHYDKGLWEHWPEIRNLTVGPCAYRDHPRISLRGNGARYWRLAEATDIFCTEAPNPFDLAKAHPDKLETIFYRDRGGRLWQDSKTYGGNYFDVSNPAFADVLVDDWKTYYRQDGTNTYWGSLWAPSSRCLWFAQVDAYLAMDNERTRPFVDPQAKNNMSDVYANFHRYLATRVKEELPGKRLVVFAYMNYLQLPKVVRDFPDNLQVLACCGSPLYACSPAYVEFAHEIFRGWGALTKYKPAVYTYDAGFAPDAVIVQTLRGYFEGAFYRTFWDEIDHEFAFPCLSEEAEEGYSWTTYLTYQAMWNPETNPDAILDEYFRLMFGERAAPHLKAFFELLKDRWVEHYARGTTTNIRGSIPGPDYKVLYTKTYPEDVVRRLLALLDAAEREIAPGSKSAMRFAKFAGAYRKVLPDIISYQRITFPEVTLVRGERTKLPPFQRAFAGGPLRAAAPTAFLTWDGDGLVLETELDAETLVASGDMWKQDSVEFLVAPGEKPVNLYQFVCTAGGEYEDLYKQVDPPRGLDINWKAPRTSYVPKVVGTRWPARLVVPWTDLKEGRAPKDGETWKFNLISNRAKPADYQSVSATLNNNRNLGYYGKLRFVEKGN